MATAFVAFESASFAGRYSPEYGNAMSLFSRRRPAPRSPIFDFWDWWKSQGQVRFSNAIESGDYGSITSQMSARVSAIHPDLQWETSKGSSSDHALCVTAAGNAELRPLAERWLRASPRPNSTWEYIAARQRDPAVLTAVLEFEKTEVDLKLARWHVVEVQRTSTLDVALTHPAFAQMDISQSQQVTFLLLDWLLGEDDVERWIGVVDTDLTGVEGEVTNEMLEAMVDELVARQTAPTWLLLESSSPDGHRVIASALSPLRWIDHPLLDLHSEVRLAYQSQREDNLPTGESLEWLRTYEDGLTESLANRGILVAHETSDGVRVLHIYTDSEDQNARDIIDTYRPMDRAGVTHAMDPAWRSVERFR
jgi:hypothetical protein